MFVRFPIILARPTSLRGSLSPDLWQKVIGRTPGGVFPRAVSGKQNSGLSCFCCFWCNKPWKNTQRGRPGFVLCVCVCPRVSPVSFLPRHADTGARAGLSGCLLGPAPPSRVPNRVLPLGQAHIFTPSLGACSVCGWRQYGAVALLSHPPVSVLCRASQPAGSARGLFFHVAHCQHVPMGRTLSLVKGF